MLGERYGVWVVRLLCQERGVGVVKLWKFETAEAAQRAYDDAVARGDEFALLRHYPRMNQATPSWLIAQEVWNDLAYPGGYPQKDAS